MRHIGYIILALFVTACNNLDNSNESGVKKNTEINKAQSVFEEKYPNINIDYIGVMKNGFFEIVVKDQIFYLTPDLSNLLAGNIIDMNTGENITKTRINSFRTTIISQIDPSNSIIYKPEKSEHILTVFTDTSCPYCKKLHGEIDELLRNNVEIRYLLFSRNGQDDAAYEEMKYIWCSDDRKLSIEKAFNNQVLVEKECDNPLSLNQKFAFDLRVNGTPMIFTERGDIIPGYVPSRQILELLKTYN